MTDAQRQYYLRQQLKAIQQELGEGDRGESSELRKRIDEAQPAGTGGGGGRTRSRRGWSGWRPASPEYQMIRTYVDWLLDIPWTVVTEDRLDPVAARARARRGPLRPRQGQGPDRRVPRRPQAEGRHEGADPLLRRPSGRGQDLARPVHRARDEPEVRAHLARRRARRGRDSRPPPHLHRRHAGAHRPGA